MKKTKGISALIVSIFLSVGLYGQQLTFSDALAPQGFYLSDQTDGPVRITYSLHSVQFEEQWLEGEKMINVMIPGSFLFNEEGCPNLPGDGRMVAIPRQSVPTLRIISMREEVVNDILVAPAPVIPKENEDGPLQQVRNSVVYSENQYYPAQPVKLSEPFKIRGVDVVTLGITPFRYNPVTRELRILRDIEVEISCSGGDGVYGEERLRNRYWDAILQDALINYSSLPKINYDQRQSVPADNTGYEYLIITPTGSAFIQWADSIRRFRIRQGISTVVKTLAEVGGNTTSAIESYINNAYNTWNPAPAAVLLLGDYGTDASNSVISPIYDSYCVSDNIYGDVDGNHLPDISMARITANNAAQLQVMVTKFLNYERNPPVSAYFYQHPISALGWQTERWFQICSEATGGFWKYVQMKDPVRINEIYSGTPGTTWSTATNTATVVNYFGPSGQNYIPAQPSSMPCCWNGGNATQINNAINSGAFCLLHRDHGGETGWGEPAYSNSNINGLTNVSNQLPFIFSVNCLTGKYNYSSECFAEKFHRYTYNGQNSGALGLIAASEVSYSFVNDTYLWGMMDNFWPDFLPTYGSNPASRGFLPCFGNSAGKYYLYQSSWPYNTGNKEVTYNLFHHHGDAFSMVYSEVPQPLSVSHAPVINANVNAFEITATAGSMIALSIDDQLLGTATGTGSAVTIPFSVVLIPGQTLHVTVTKQNFFRYDADVEIIPATGAWFYAEPTEICTGETVSFTDMSAGNTTSWYWTFPGGVPAVSTVASPQNIHYAVPGLYTVTLMINSSNGPDTLVRTNYITVKNVSADFSATNQSVVIGNSVTFTDLSDCTPEMWYWMFPGGTPSAHYGQNPPPIQYNTLGSYDVTLAVFNQAGGDTLTKAGFINVIPPVYNITNGTINACSGDFYDSGGPSGSYQSSENYTFTIYPSTPGSRVRAVFNSFSTESGYDYLKVYNGTSTAASMIGSYHGSSGPGTITANNADGALTFNFTSDGSVTYPGWSASISCAGEFVANPTGFSAAAVSTSRIDLTWSLNASGHGVMLVCWPTPAPNLPVNGTQYPVGSAFPGGGTVLYNGSQSNFSHTGLNGSTTYYYKIFSCTAALNYSDGAEVSCPTMCGNAPLPYSESFPASTLPPCVTKQVTGTASDKWTISNTSFAGGTAYEMKSTWQSANPAASRLVLPPINSLGSPTLNLSFRHMLDAYGTGCTIRVQSSSNGTTWTNEAWAVSPGSTNIGPEVVNTTIVNNVNIPNTYIAFTIEGNLYQYDYWYVDNVNVTSGCATFNPVSVTIEPSANGITAGTLVQFTALPVNGGSAPVFQWQVNGVNAGSGGLTFEYAPLHQDTVTCILTSNASCVTGNPAISNSVVMQVDSPLPVSTLQNMTVSSTDCFDALQTILVAGSGTEFNVVYGGWATLIAGEKISFLPGTNVQNGGYLHGYIAPLGPWCNVNPTMPGTMTGVTSSYTDDSGPRILLFPNPTDCRFSVVLPAGSDPRKCRLEVFNMNGMRVRSIEHFTDRTEIFSIEGQPAGIYLVRVFDGNQFSAHRLVKTE